MTQRILEINNRNIGPGCPCFIIAEAGVNHNGNLEYAHRLIQVAADAGADAIKFQTFKADRLTSREAPKANYQLERTEASESQFEMLHQLELPAEAYPELIEECSARKILFMSSPFDEASVDFLDTLGMAAFKVPSGEITNPAYLIHVAHKGKPMIISTGMATMNEVDFAVRTVRGAGNENFALLQCVSNYPAEPEDVNLRAMITMAETFGVVVGFSDHTLGLEIPLAAAALGAAIIEKHITLDRSLPGPDQAVSLEPEQLKALVTGVRKIEAALGHGRKEPAASEVNTASVARKSLVARCDIPAGTRLTEEHLIALRPGTGLSPKLLPSIVGRVTKVDILAGTLLTMEMLG